MIDVSRRSFFAGMGAAIVLAALPSVATSATLTRRLPKISLQMPSQPYLTASYLAEAIRDLYRQVAILESMRPTKEERGVMIQEINEALFEIRPPGLEIFVETPLEDILRGEFEIWEERPGTVVIA